MNQIHHIFLYFFIDQDINKKIFLNCSYCIINIIRYQKMLKTESKLFTPSCNASNSMWSMEILWNLKNIFYFVWILNRTLIRSNCLTLSLSSQGYKDSCSSALRKLNINKKAKKTLFKVPGTCVYSSYY